MTSKKLVQVSVTRRIANAYNTDHEDIRHNALTKREATRFHQLIPAACPEC